MPVYDEKREKEVGKWSLGFAGVLKQDGDWVYVKTNEFPGEQLGWVKQQSVMTANDSIGFYNSQVQQKPDMVWLQCNRGIARRLRGEYEAAVKDLSAAMRHTKAAFVAYNRGNAYLDDGQHIPAIDDFTRAIRLEPKYVSAYYNRAFAYFETKEFDKAIADFTAVGRLDPKDAGVPFNLGNIYSAKGEADKAVESYTEAVRLDPEFAQAYYNRGLLYGKRKDFAKAIADYSAAVKVEPVFGVAYTDRALAFAATGEYAKAAADHKLAVKHSPKDFRCFHNYAWFLATCPNADHRDGKLAVELAKEAIVLTKERDPSCYSGLGVAYAECGEFEKAIESEKAALENKAYAANHGESGREFIKLYEQKKPVRMPAPKH
ncbi:TPR repeat-containing protein [Limnoglobus roseus]|uniref:TPR repeat-containing protein n=1 Tax=Limnoglobus roseus TaxID=2598579 RepID=A0A5C1ABM5_9BACT|nr:TPR repeat-containing protein [Limnoglobus roseus]